MSSRLIAFTDAAAEPWALVLFSFAAFALTALAQEFWRGAAARRALSGGSLPGALVAVATRNRRRYGGYIVHVGIARVADRHRRRRRAFRPTATSPCAPGESATVDDYEITYERPTVDVSNERIAFGAMLDVAQRRRGLRPARPDPQLLPPQRRAERPDLQPTSPARRRARSASRPASRSDFWTAVQPDLTAGPAQRHRGRRAASRACVRGGAGTPQAAAPSPR